MVKINKTKVLLLLALFLTGCFLTGRSVSRSDDDYDDFESRLLKLFLPLKMKTVGYTIEISSSDAKDITVYLPFPHYKRKPDMRILEWLKENLKKHYLSASPSRYSKYIRGLKENWKIATNIKLDLIDTEYGKMLSIYIPRLSISKEEKIYFDRFELGIGKFNSHDRSFNNLNTKTMLSDYKLSYEDNIKPEMELIDPESETNDRVWILKMPIYVQFEGNELNVDLRCRFFCTRSGPFDWAYDTVAELRYIPGSLENPLLYVENYTFTKSGWHWMPIKKKYGNIEEK